METSNLMLSTQELREYKNWVGKSPVDIREAAIRAGGWMKVFPMRNLKGTYPNITVDVLPVWASRVRNYFNEEPSFLRLLPSQEALMRTAVDTGSVGSLALSGDVYVDEHGRYWFEMSTVATVHHTPGKVTKRKMAKYFLSSQATVPVFKLISPDGTGGSMEVCVKNPQNRELGSLNGIAIRAGSKTIGKTGEMVSVRSRLETDEVLRGSYNYAETVVSGFNAHTRMDVNPHIARRGFYINPPLFSPLSGRRFQESDPSGRALAGMAGANTREYEALSSKWDRGGE